MEEDVEVLEPTDTSKFLIPQLTKLVTAIKEVPVMVMNGVVQQTQKIPVVACLCPSCDTVILEFPQGIPLEEVNKALTTNEQLLANAPSYCPKCGQRLSHKREVVSEVENHEEEVQQTVQTNDEEA